MTPTQWVNRINHDADVAAVLARTKPPSLLAAVGFAAAESIMVLRGDQPALWLAPLAWGVVGIVAFYAFRIRRLRGLA